MNTTLPSRRKSKADPRRLVTSTKCSDARAVHKLVAGRCYVNLWAVSFYGCTNLTTGDLAVLGETYECMGFFDFSFTNMTYDMLQRTLHPFSNVLKLDVYGTRVAEQPLFLEHALPNVWEINGNFALAVNRERVRRELASDPVKENVMRRNYILFPQRFDSVRDCRYSRLSAKTSVGVPGDFTLRKDKDELKLKKFVLNGIISQALSESEDVSTLTDVLFHEHSLATKIVFFVVLFAALDRDVATIVGAAFLERVLVRLAFNPDGANGAPLERLEKFARRVVGLGWLYKAELIFVVLAKTEIMLMSVDESTRYSVVSEEFWTQTRALLFSIMARYHAWHYANVSTAESPLARHAKLSFNIRLFVETQDEMRAFRRVAAEFVMLGIAMDDIAVPDEARALLSLAARCVDPEFAAPVPTEESANDQWYDLETYASSTDKHESLLVQVKAAIFSKIKAAYASMMDPVETLS